jgi:hypothetical protein
MKSIKMMKCLSAMSLVIALFAGKSQAAFYQLPAGSFTVMTHIAGVCENPNGFPVVTIQASQLANSTAGFLLDGSESASNWLKLLQDAALGNRSIRIYTNDNWALALCGQVTENGYTGGAYRILAVQIAP